MCLIVLSFEIDPRFRLVMASNRDEFYARPTAPAAFWPERPAVLAGRDLEQGGTWQGVTREGRFAVLTNYRDLASVRPGAPSRGQLVSDFLEGSESPEQYARALESRVGEYNPFNLLVGCVGAEPAKSELWYVGSRAGAATRLPPGVYGLSNHVLDTPWPKLSRAKEAFVEVLAGGGEERAVTAKMLEFLAWPERALDHELPSTGVPLELERALSSLFIVTPNYGTRCSTVVLMNRSRRVSFLERSFGVGGVPSGDAAFSFLVGEK